jgi:hypothetical protein
MRAAAAAILPAPRPRGKRFATPRGTPARPPRLDARAAVGGQGLAQGTNLVPCAATEQTAWRYTTDPPPETWAAPDFDDSGWKEGKAGFGALGWGAKIGTPWTTGDIWLRRRFTLAARPAAPLLRVFHDEDVEVYLNGVPACRDGGFQTGYDDFEIDGRAAATLKAGENTIAVHCRQTSGGQFIDVGLLDASPPARGK